MTNRELSEKLCALACRLEGIVDALDPAVRAVAIELHALSNEKYTPNASWDTVKKATEHKQVKKRGYTDSKGRTLPF